MAGPSTPSQTVTWKGAVAAVLIGGILTVGIAEVFLRFFMPHWREFYSGRFIQAEVVPGYGTTHIGRPGFDGYFAQNNGDFRVRIRINDFGLRNPGSVARADGRVWIVGDSMAFGWGVEYDETYSRRAAADARVPTYSVTSPGADICGYQALVARMPKTARPKAVVVGIILENDLRKYACPRGEGPDPATTPPPDSGSAITLAAVKEYMTRISALYNFLAVGLKRVALVNRVLTWTGVVKRPHSAADGSQISALGEFVDDSVDELHALKSMFAPGTPFAVMIAPTRWEVRDKHRDSRRLREAIAEALRRRGIDVIDPVEGFIAAGFRPTHFVHDGHWSALGHRIAGRAIALWLKSKVADVATPASGEPEAR